jgi:hypothetical protein
VWQSSFFFLLLAAATVAVTRWIPKGWPNFEYVMEGNLIAIPTTITSLNFGGDDQDSARKMKRGGRIGKERGQCCYAW